MELYSKDLKSGYKISVELLDNDANTLSAKVSNSKDEFVGQIFLSKDNIANSVSRLSNYEVTLTDNEVKDILSKIPSDKKTKATESDTTGSTKDKVDTTKTKKEDKKPKTESIIDPRSHLAMNLSCENEFDNLELNKNESKVPVESIISSLLKKYK